MVCFYGAVINFVQIAGKTSVKINIEGERGLIVKYRVRPSYFKIFLS